MTQKLPLIAYAVPAVFIVGGLVVAIRPRQAIDWYVRRREAELVRMKAKPPILLTRLFAGLFALSGLLFIFIALGAVGGAARTN